MSADVDTAVILSRKDGYAFHRIGERGEAPCGVFRSDAAFRDGSVVTNGDELEVATKAEAEREGFSPCGLCFDDEGVRDDE